jgi:hypothetical protein
VVPVAPLQAGGAERPLHQSRDDTLERPLLWLAMLLLASDAALLARRLLRERRRPLQAQA